MSTDLIQFQRSDLDLIAAFAGCSLDEKPGSNWVQDAGGLPDYICRIARAVKKTGKTTSQAVSIAVSRVKVWATGTGVDKDTQAKAAAAVAEWEKLKAKAHTKTAAKHGAAVMAATHTLPRDPTTLLLTDYNVDIVQQAFHDRTRQARNDYVAANPTAPYDDRPPFLWVKEQWTSYLIVCDDGGRNQALYKVPYSVDDNLVVTFDDPIEVKTEYVEVNDLSGAHMTDADLQALLAMTPPCPPRPAVAQFMALTRPTALQKVLALAAAKDADGDAPDAEDMSDEDKGKAMVAQGMKVMAKAKKLSGDAADEMMAKGKKMMAKGKAMMGGGKADSGGDSMGMTVLALAATHSRARTPLDG